MNSLEGTLESLKDPDLEVRERALKSVEAAVETGLRDDQITSIIRSARDDLPLNKPTWGSGDAELIQCVWGHCSDLHAEVLGTQYPFLSDPGRAAALACLAKIGTIAAAATYTDVLRTFGWPSESYPAMTAWPMDPSEAVNLILSALFDSTVADVDDFLRLLLLWDAVKQDILSREVQRIALPEANRIASDAIAALGPLQRRDGIGWRWEDDYLELRHEAGLVLDFLGHAGPDREARATLERGQALIDPWIQHRAVVALIRLGQSPDPEAVLGAASDAETRVSLLRQLDDLGRRDLFPASELVQEKLAESDMVSWLAYPTELGRAPDHIELMESVEFDSETDAGLFTLYLFRFKTDPPHWSADEGWMAGVSGPFRNADFPTYASWGDTFSKFTPWAELSPDEHLSSILELMARWREHHA